MSYAIVTKEDEKSYKIRDFLIDKIKDEYDETKPTKVITVGGDGTFLKAVHMFEKNIDNIVFLFIIQDILVIFQIMMMIRLTR